MNLGRGGGGCEVTLATIVLCHAALCLAPVPFLVNALDELYTAGS